MKYAISFFLSGMLWKSCLFGQARTDAEERYRIKTGRLHPDAERRLQEAKKTTKRSPTIEGNERRNKHDEAAGDSAYCSCGYGSSRIELCETRHR
jgi:hypothetical protein